MGEFSWEFLQDLVAALQRTGVDYIVVGGQAIAVHVPVATGDLDVFVALRDFERAIKRLRKEPMFGTPEKEKWIAKWEIHYTDWHSDVADVDMLNCRPYAGKLSPDEFFDFIRSEWTSPGPLGPTAAPAVVWYSRLLAVGDWRIWGRKIIRDLGAGAPKEWFDGVRAIADRTGTLSLINERIEYVEAQAATEAAE